MCNLEVDGLYERILKVVIEFLGQWESICYETSICARMHL
jgi:hypothetical protein